MASADQIAANRQNSLKSTGPNTNDGKCRSRANSLKAGLTGEGICLPNEDVEALDARLAAFEGDLKPQNDTEHALVRRFALMTIRLDRLALQEAKAVSSKMRNAPSAFDDARMAEADHLISWIASEPVTNNRRLKQTAEGLTRLIEAVDGLRSDLTRQPGYRWDYSHCDQLHHYLGMRRENMPITRIRALTEAIQGKFENIDPSEIPESETLAKRRWAIGQMVALLDGELAKLKTLLETFDPSAIDLDRAEAAERAMFDDSKEGILARKYEGACERSMYKALRELRELRAESAQLDHRKEPATEPAGELASFFPEGSGDEVVEADVDSTVADPADPVDARRKRPRLDGKKGVRDRRRGRSERPKADPTGPGTSLSG